jgi:hypothetical protein
LRPEKLLRMKEDVEEPSTQRHTVDINININLEEYRNQFSHQNTLPAVKSDKLKTSLSVSQLVYAFRVFNELGLINVKNQMDLFKFIADNFQTPNTDEISLHSLRSKYYSIDPSTKDAMRDIAQKVLNKISRD